VTDNPDRQKIKEERDAWNKTVNWVMDERRIENLRALGEERDRKLKELAKVDVLLDKDCSNGGEEECLPKKRIKSTTALSSSSNDFFGAKTSCNGNQSASIQWGSGRPDRSAPSMLAVESWPPRKNGSPAHSSSATVSLIRPGLLTPPRPNSPRRFDKRRGGIHTGLGEFSPRGRGGTYTPPRILPSGDETAPYNGNGSPAPSLQTFDFVSPLGPASLSRLPNGIYGSDRREKRVWRQ